jgi:parvulin-like peptidyl-prolyl isomerase
VETRHGFHLLQVIRRIPSHVQPEKEVHDEIAAKLSRQRQERFYDKWVEQLIEDSDIRVHASLVQLAVKEEPTQPIPFKHEESRATQ